MDALDLDANFEPLSRARSNTWPLPRPEYYVDKDCDDKVVVVPATIQESSGDAGSQQQPKKNSSRRNAWGNKSYADLITQAIQSSQDRRLTLSQIYDWMVQNVAYFKDKGDSNSSAGWKNSIRHNLSLHNRFMRVQNEGTGKSSWWMVNPDAKPGKAARRRATSMETPKYERKRTKAKEAKAKALRLQQQQQQQQSQQASAQGGVTPSPSSSVSEGLDMFPESPHASFQLSPETFRPRASSNASSCGRLSPIPAVDGDLLQDNSSQQMPPLSPIPWNTYGRPASNSMVDKYLAEQLVDSLTVAMKLGSGDNGYLDNTNPSPSPPAPPPPAPSTPTPGQVRIKTEYPPVPPTNVQVKSEFPQRTVLMKSEYSSLPAGVRIKSEYQAQIKAEYKPPVTVQIKSEYPQPNVQIKSEYSLYDTPVSYVDRHQDFGYQSQPSSPTTGVTLVPSPSQPCTSPQQDPFQPTPKMVTSAEAYRYLLQQQQQQERSGSKDPQTGINSTAHLMMGHLTFNNTLPYDLDLNTLQGGLECDVDQVIRHELSVDGELDFNFDPMAAAAAAAHANSMSSRPWVH